MFEAVLNNIFVQWFHETEKKRTGLPDWCPPTEVDPEYYEYFIRKESAWAAWVDRKNYPLMTKKAVSLPEEMYVLLTHVRDARQAEIDNRRSPAIQRDLFTHAVRSLGDYLIRYDIAGSADSLSPPADNLKVKSA